MLLLPGCEWKPAGPCEKRGDEQSRDQKAPSNPAPLCRRIRPPKGGEISTCLREKLEGEGRTEGKKPKGEPKVLAQTARTHTQFLQALRLNRRKPRGGAQSCQAAYATRASRRGPCVFMALVARPNRAPGNQTTRTEHGAELADARADFKRGTKGTRLTPGRW